MGYCLKHFIFYPRLFVAEFPNAFGLFVPLTRCIGLLCCYKSQCLGFGCLPKAVLGTGFVLALGLTSFCRYIVVVGLARFPGTCFFSAANRLHPTLLGLETPAFVLDYLI